MIGMPANANDYVIKTLNNCDKALSVLFTMLAKSAPQGACAADEIRGHIKNALHWARDFDRREKALSAQVDQYAAESLQAKRDLIRLKDQIRSALTYLDRPDFRNQLGNDMWPASPTGDDDK